MAFFMDPGAMFLGCQNGVEQKFLIELIKTARRSGYTRFVEPCAGTFAMANLAIQSGFKPEQIETSDVNMMTSVMGYAITGQSLEPLQIHAQGFSDEELLDPAVALYAQIYLRTSKSAGNEYFHNILRDLHDRREEHIESIRRQLEATKSLLGGMSYRPMDMWDHLREVKDDPHTIIVANPPTYFAGYADQQHQFRMAVRENRSHGSGRPVPEYPLWRVHPERLVREVRGLAQSPDLLQLRRGRRSGARLQQRLHDHVVQPHGDGIRGRMGGGAGMIDTAKLNTEELGNIIVDVQNETGFWFDVDDMVAIMQHTVRKADLNGKDEAYVPLLFRNELEDYVMRERINAIGRRNLCATSVCTALA